MARIIGVRFRNAGKVYYFDPKGLDFRRDDRVIVETARGVECGRVVLPAREVPDEKVVQPLRPVIRKADENDLKREQENIEKEKEAYRICRRKIREHGLDMKLVQAEYTFDNKKVLFYFTADGRVDFRDLVKDLASVFRTRIELRQIGVRDETKLLGGVGICGRPLCCASYLSDFAPVSIRMAKEQNLSLNPAKISGVCGRLMCCLKNEEETYEFLNKQLPGVGDIMETPEGKEGIVQTVNVLKQSVRVLIEEGDDKEIEEHPASEMKLLAKRKKGGGYINQPGYEGREKPAAEAGGADRRSSRSESGRDSRKQGGRRPAGTRPERSEHAAGNGAGRSEHAAGNGSGRSERAAGNGTGWSEHAAGSRPERDERHAEAGSAVRPEQEPREKNGAVSDEENPERRRRRRRRRHTSGPAGADGGRPADDGGPVSGG